MPKVIFLPNAGRNLVKLREFIVIHNREAAARAARVILEAADSLGTHPQQGRPCEELLEYRELIIPFGASGYMLRYRIENETIYVVAIKHCKEAGFEGDG